MPENRNASVRSPAPHPRRRARLRREFKLGAVVEAEERSKPDPVTHEDMREMLARRMTLLADRWRGCPERLCKRHRYCVKPRAKCTRHPAPEPTPLTYEQRALYERIWQQMLADREAARAEREREAEV